MCFVIFKSSSWLFLAKNCKKWVISKFKENRLLLNHSLISTKTVLTLLENSTELGLVIIILVSLVYNTNLALLDVTVGISFIINKKNKGQRFDPCDMLC